MKYIEDLSIRSFRGIKDLELKNLIKALWAKAKAAYRDSLSTLYSGGVKRDSIYSLGAL